MDDDESYLDVEGDEPLLDVRDIVHVCYTRGLVKKLSDLRAGRSVRVTEWTAPHIPQAVLDSIEREAIDALEGEWGDPKVGDPIQVDVIDLETDEDVVSLHVFNRAICLLHADSEEMRRIHRVCGALESAAATDQAATDANVATTTATKKTHVPPRPPALDLSAVLKSHRRQGGTCELCGEDLTRTGARKHLDVCAPAHDVTKGPEQQLVHIRATAPGHPAYWLDFEIKADTKLEALDSFLRRTWLECCGHLSAFDIGPVKYRSRGYEFGLTGAFGAFGAGAVSERSMNAKIADAIPSIGERFTYEYDFGSTTTLHLTVVDERAGRIGSRAVRLLAQNTAPVWPCAICAEPATVVCAYCLHDETTAFACARHRRQHPCGETEGFLPVVNSPRMGVCGYGAVAGYR